MLPLRTVTHGDLTTAYRDDGDGDSHMIFVHGWASSSRMWQASLRALSDSFHGWAIDLAGFGDSDGPRDGPRNGWYSIENWTAQVEQFARERGIVRPVVVGHSMGGMIALALAASRPDFARGIAVINPVVRGNGYRAAHALFRSPLAGMVSRIAALTWPVAVSAPIADPFGFRSWRSESFKRNRLDWAKVRGDVAVKAVRAVVMYDASECLSTIRVPTLVLLGERDTTAPNSQGHLAATRVPGARLIVLPAGHLPTDDVPDQTHAALRDFALKLA